MYHLIFDFDDTLVKTIETKWSALKFAGKSLFGQQITDELLKAHWGKPFRELIYGLFGNIDYEMFYAEYSGRIARQFPMRLNAGAQGLKRLPYKKYILSASDEGLILDDLKLLKVNADFELVWGQDSAKYSKPDPRVFDPVFNHFESIGIEKSKLIYIGDNITDYFAAKLVDVRFIAVTTGLTVKDEFTRFGLHESEVINSLRQLPGLLDPAG